MLLLVEKPCHQNHYAFIIIKQNDNDMLAYIEENSKHVIFPLSYVINVENEGFPDLEPVATFVKRHKDYIEKFPILHGRIKHLEEKERIKKWKTEMDEKYKELLENNNKMLTQLTGSRYYYEL